MSRRLIDLIVALSVVILVASFAVNHVASAQPQQSEIINPSANVQSEQQLLGEARRIQGIGSIPDEKSYVVEQPAGRGWSVFRRLYLPLIGAGAIGGIFCLLAGFYAWRGGMHFGARANRKMRRFTAFERFVHWMATVSFIVLALTGLNFTFGRYLLLPVFGSAFFSAWSQAAKYAHNFFSFPFTIGVILMFLVWVASNLPARVDIEWLKRGGGMFGGEHPPAGKFHAGEKMIFWTVVLGGGLVAVTGYILIFPFFGTEIVGMQIAHIIHGIVGVLYVAAMFVHIFMGTIGVKGAFEGMVTGDVDVNWAKSHHSIWYEEQLSESEALSQVHAAPSIANELMPSPEDRPMEEVGHRVQDPKSVVNAARG